MRDNLHRFVWILIAVLFVLSSFGILLYSVFGNKSGTATDNYIKCSTPSSKDKFSLDNSKASKVKGTKMVGFTPGSAISYVKCSDFKVGTGAVTTASSTVTVLYSGALVSDGTIFDSSIDSGQPLTIGLNQVIPGWTTGMQGMKAGGQRRLLIPAQYGYGSQVQPGIPANSDLVFDVTLLSVK